MESNGIGQSEPGQRVITMDVRALLSWIALHGVDVVWRQVVDRLVSTGHGAWRCRALIDAALVTIDSADQRGGRYFDARSHHDRGWGATLLGRTGVVVFEALDADQRDSDDVNQHALEVSQAIRFLQRHLEHALQHRVPPREQDAVGFVLQAIQWADG